MSYRRHTKPFLDFMFSLVLLVLLSPLFLLLILLLAISQNGHVFFLQPRVGLKDQVFRIVKFKTMKDSTDRDGRLLPDEQRLTKIGKLVRKLSLDEIPQLLNVMKGEMSFIGPRPLLVDYLPLYNETQRRRHLVKPGITGWAQVNGRNDISWEKRFEYDIYYVNYQSFYLDVQIVYRTFLKVVTAEGINAKGMATMERFKGNQL